MALKTIIARASRGLREDARLHVVAFFSLTIAFLCLGTALVALTNLSAIAETWGQSARMTVFLRDGAQTREVAELRLAVDGLAEVEAVELVTSADAREQFVRDSDIGSALEGLPTEAFPASLEVQLRGGTTSARVQEIAERVARFGPVEDIETYHGWFGRLERLLEIGRSLAAGLALLVIFCVVFVVGNTIRLVVAGRQAEIEVMKLCGASDGFVRGPFLVEGGMQGFAASFLAIVVLLVAFLVAREHIDGTVAALIGVRAVFLPPLVALAMLAGGTFLGIAGSMLSLRRYLTV